MKFKLFFDRGWEAARAEPASGRTHLRSHSPRTLAVLRDKTCQAHFCRLQFRVAQKVPAHCFVATASVSTNCSPQWGPAPSRPMFRTGRFPTPE